MKTTKLLLTCMIGVLLIGFKSPPKTGSIEDECLILINKKREKKGLESLTNVDYLQELAREHSMKMSKYIRGFGHKGWDERADLIFDNVEVEFVAENVGFNKGYDDPADKVVEGWMKSNQHKDNILNQDFDITGIGVAKAKDGTYFFTQIFASYLE